MSDRDGSDGDAMHSSSEPNSLPQYTSSSMEWKNGMRCSVAHLYSFNAIPSS
jgi:hypothetical protein